MASKVVRVSEEALAAAQPYGSDLSTAILVMQAKIEELRHTQLDSKTLTKIVTGAVSDAMIDLRHGY